MGVAAKALNQARLEASVRVYGDENEKEKAEKRAKKDAMEKENLIRCTTISMQMVFTGSLSSKNKTELQDLASVLKLSIAGTKVKLQQHIEDEFNKHPELKDEAQFSGLFRQLHKQSATTNNDTNAGFHDVLDSQPPLQRCCLNTTAGTIPIPLYLHHPSSPLLLPSLLKYRHPAHLHAGPSTMPQYPDHHITPSHSLYQ